MIKAWDDDAWDDYLHWRTQDRKTPETNQRSPEGHRPQRLRRHREARAAEGEPIWMVEPQD